MSKERKKVRVIMYEYIGYPPYRGSQNYIKLHLIPPPPPQLDPKENLILVGSKNLI